MMTEQNDILVADYLTRVTRATARLAPERQEELLRDLREHIEAGRAEVGGGSELQIREILDRLGDPAVIAAAAAAENTGAVLAPAASSRRNLSTRVVVALALAVLVIVVLCFWVFFASATSSPAPASS